MRIRLEGEPQNNGWLTFFTEQFLTEAPAEYVKVYLVLRAEAQKAAGQSISRENLAESADVSLRCFVRSLKYWREKNLFRWLDPTDQGEECLLMCRMPGEIITSEREPEKLPITDGVIRKAKTETSQSKENSLLSSSGANAGNTRPAALSYKKKMQIAGEADFQDLVHEFSVYMPPGLSSAQLDQLMNLYGNLGISYDVLHHLLEMCVERSQAQGRQGLESFRYFEKIALDWHSKGILTKEDLVRTADFLPAKEHYQILKYFGIRTDGCVITAQQKEYINRWLYEYGFGMDIVRMAADKSCDKDAKPVFAKANKILEDWHKAGVRTAADAEKEMAAFARKFEEEKNAKEKKEGKYASSASRNDFHNFKQRKYDYQQLMNQVRKEK